MFPLYQWTPIHIHYHQQLYMKNTIAQYKGRGNSLNNESTRIQYIIQLYNVYKLYKYTWKHQVLYLANFTKATLSCANQSSLPELGGRGLTRAAYRSTELRFDGRTTSPKSPFTLRTAGRRPTQVTRRHVRVCFCTAGGRPTQVTRRHLCGWSLHLKLHASCNILCRPHHVLSSCELLPWYSNIMLTHLCTLSNPMFELVGWSVQLSRSNHENAHPHATISGLSEHPFTSSTRSRIHLHISKPCPGPWSSLHLICNMLSMMFGVNVLREINHIYPNIIHL